MIERSPAPEPRPQADKLGEVVRSEGVAHLLNLGIPNLPGYAQRIMYTSTTQDGDIVATPGAVFEPKTRWIGEGPVPTVVVPPGTRGQGDQCAPSKGGLLLGNITLASGPTMTVNYEIQTV